MVGQRFGRLVVLQESPERKSGRRAWICQCDCGNITTVIGSNLRENGGTISCGCAAVDNKLIDITGQKFGKLTVLSYVGHGNDRSSLWKCRCDCGNEVIRTGDALHLNTNSSCGCTTESIGVSYIKKLLIILQRIVDNGDTVIVIEHNLDVIKVADYIIDLGPEGGDMGGTIVAAGTPEEIAKNNNSYTGEFLKQYLK